MSKSKLAPAVLAAMLLSLGFVQVGEAILPKTSEGLASGFLKGGDFLKMNDHEKNAYVMGVVDGIAYALQSQGKTGSITGVGDCGKGLSNIRHAIVFNHNLNRHPMREEIPMPMALPGIIEALCGETGK